MFEPGPGLTYDRILRGGRPGWGWGLLGALTLAIAWLVVVPGVLMMAMAVALNVTGTADAFDAAVDLLDTTDMTPAGLAMLNVVLGSGIPIVIMLVAVIHGLRPGWVMSVVGRVRWGWLGICFGLALAALFATVVVSLFIPAEASDSMSGQLNDFTTVTAQYLVVILLLTPVQAIAEEYVFRGYLTQAFGLLGSRVVAVVAPAFLFACAHAQSLEISGQVFLGQTYPIFIDRFAFGLVAGVLVILTGGMEAAIAMHVLNNFLAFGAALMFSDMTTAMTPTEGTWWQLPVTLTQSLVFTGLVVLVAHRTGLARRTQPPENLDSEWQDRRVLQAPNPFG
ncbi:MAG: lysostaphin resistance A-like protein [Nocardioides sp.]